MLEMTLRIIVFILFMSYVSGITFGIPTFLVFLALSKKGSSAFFSSRDEAKIFIIWVFLWPILLIPHAIQKWKEL